MGLGTLIGGGIGALLGAVFRPETGLGSDLGSAAALTAIALAPLGFFVGTVTGIVTSTDDVTIEPRTNADFSSLKPFARFPLSEPEYLHEIK